MGHFKRLNVATASPAHCGREMPDWIEGVFDPCAVVVEQREAALC